MLYNREIRHMFGLYGELLLLHGRIYTFPVYNPARLTVCEEFLMIYS